MANTQQQQLLVSQAKQKLGMDSNLYHIGVVGQSGVGKSTLINGFRLLKDNHPDAAPVGETETTSRIKRYPHPTQPQIVFWDVPGAGTLYHPDSTYFSDNSLHAFDCLLVATSDRFLKVDFEIAKKARELNKPCAFVRTKADVAVKQLAERTGKRMRDASKDVRSMVDESMQKGLRECDESCLFPLFIVSAWAFTKKNAYHLYKYKTREFDTSLESMDEDQLSTFITNLIRAREKEKAY